MLGPALVMNGHSSPGGPMAAASRSPAARTVMTLLAIAELLADKNPNIPSRIEPMPLGARMVSGALAAAGSAQRGRRIQAAAAGAAGAVLGAYGLYHLRRAAGERLRLSNAVVGLAEDALALGAGMLLLRYREALPRDAGR